MIVEILGDTEVEVKVDSHVVVNQVLEAYTTKCKKLKKYMQLIWEKRDQFCHFRIKQIPSESNNIVDKLARAASGMEDLALPWEFESRMVEVPAVGIEIAEMGPGELKWA